MTEDEIALIRATFAMVRPGAGQAALLFDTRLAERDAGAVKVSAAGLVAAVDRALAAAVSAGPETAADALAPLAGGAHDGIADALLWMVERSLGPAAFTPPVRDAWTALLAPPARVASGAPRRIAA